MAWVTAATNDWIYVTASLGINRSTSPASSNIYNEYIKYQGVNYAYKSNKYYYFTTDVVGLSSVTFSMRPGFSAKMPSTGTTITSHGIASVASGTTYSSRYFNTFQPVGNPVTNDAVYYYATNAFTASAFITNTKVQEIEWLISGYKQFGIGTTSSSFSDIDYDGWSFDTSINTMWWVSKPGSAIGMTGLSIIGSQSTNFIAKSIPYDRYNVYFQYQTFTGSSTDGIKIYTSTSQNGTRQLIESITQSASASIHRVYGLTGGGGWIFFVGDITSNASGFAAALTNISVEGGYHPLNNEQFLFTDSATYSDPTQLQIIGANDATYSFLVGTGSTVINSKFGNGTFRAGVWENGVWNSGWRVDQSVYQFDDIYLSIKTISDKRWRIQVDGPSSSVSNFNIGDRVSIGNIVAIDINEERKLLKGYFTIINKTTTSIIVEIDTNFPYRRIEKDSPYHKIKITKNVWLNGGFLNGYFSGVWNYGLFKGFPMITEMYDTDWIDGVFDGGHFNSSYATASFNGTTASGSNLGLTFSSGHNFVVGDTLVIDKDNKSLNPEYDGSTNVISVVDDYLIIVDKLYGTYYAGETGIVTNTKANAVIQNFKFYDNNVAKKISSQSTNTAEVFQFYSWIDVNYYNTSAVNIGKPTSLFDVLTRSEYSLNNLYGYPTFDVLSSVSSFRDSYSSAKRNYKLGTKYKVYTDFIGQGSEFDRPFDMGIDPVTPLSPRTPFQGIGLDTFFEYGWTYSIGSTESAYYPDSNSFYYRSTEDQSQASLDLDESLMIKGEELVISSYEKGSVLNNSNINIEKLRYSVIEMDMLTYSLADVDGNFIPNPLDKTGPNLPVIHFNNINTYLKNIVYYNPFIGTYSTTQWQDTTYLPIYQNINHVLTPGIKKYEYFYNKRSLALNTLGSGVSGIGTFSTTIDNLKFYEIDMVPFFQYFIDDNIYKGVVIPYQGIAPFIDYSDSNFSFIDNINISLSTMDTQQSFTPISGVGLGIGNSLTTSSPIFATVSSG